MNNAGYDPEIIPVVIVNPRMISKKEGSRKLTDKCFSVNELNDGMINATISKERQTARNDTNNDSPMN
jgi:peptide deformylase